MMLPTVRLCARNARAAVMDKNGSHDAGGAARACAPTVLAWCPWQVNPRAGPRVSITSSCGRALRVTPGPLAARASWAPDRDLRGRGVVRRVSRRVLHWCRQPWPGRFEQAACVRHWRGAREPSFCSSARGPCPGRHACHDWALDAETPGPGCRVEGRTRGHRARRLNWTVRQCIDDARRPRIAPDETSMREARHRGDGGARQRGRSQMPPCRACTTRRSPR